jgi:hypothetical protein
MSFLRHPEIFPSDGSASLAAHAPAHRLDEFPAGYSLAGCSPAEPASASPAGHQYAVMSSCPSRPFQRTANCVLTVCVRPGGKRTSTRRIRITFLRTDAWKTNNPVMAGTIVDAAPQARGSGLTQWKLPTRRSAAISSSRARCAHDAEMSLRRTSDRPTVYENHAERTST